MNWQSVAIVILFILIFVLLFDSYVMDIIPNVVDVYP